MAIKVRLNDVIVNKLDSIGFDLKYCINVNAELGKALEDSFDEATVNNKCFSEEDLSELILIRTRLGSLTTKLRLQVKNQK